METTPGKAIYLKPSQWLAATGLLLLALCFAASTRAADFGACVADLQRQAREEGLAPRLIDILGRVNERKRVVELDRSQPEFTQTFANYFERRVTSDRIRRGRRLLERHRELLDQLTVEYGIPPQYLVAFWGLETNFGRTLGSIGTLDALATLACDERRSALFTTELFEALRLLEDEQLEVETLRGSWAGAMGQTQFSASAYRRYAVDRDQDGRTDLWSSIPDALASAANYLQGLGWERELRWGREVQVDADFDYSSIGLDQRRRLSDWRNLGVAKTDGSPLPRVDVEASLLVPAGAEGPKFLVYDNFHVIMRWNRSQFYALSVGHLADRISGAGDLHNPLPDSKPLRFTEVEALQLKLKNLGFDPGAVDGVLGPATSRAIREYQRSSDVTADGFADVELLQTLGLADE